MFKQRSQNCCGRSAKCTKLTELVLPNAKLRFCPDQLQNLNYFFNKKLADNSALSSEKSILLARSVTERLVQRLLCQAGVLDSRFATKYLICNHDQQENNTNLTNLEYFARIDCLSTPTLYETDPPPQCTIIETDSDHPAGYARIRLHNSTYKTWSNYINSSGYLRRDKVQARLVELLAQAASQDNINSPLLVDESILCGIPGKVIDPVTLNFILKIPSDHQVYYGPGGSIPRFPDPRDFKLAIVDEPSGIRLKVEFLSPTLSSICMNVRILVAIGVNAWPATTDFPSRVSLGHTDCLIYHQAAKTGMFLVGFGVQSSAWQIRLPAAEFVLINHYGSLSTVRTVLDVLYDALDEIDKKRQNISYKVLNRYIILTVLLEELEEGSLNPTMDMINWSPIYLSTLVLKLLDKTISKLRAEKQPNYFFKKANLLVNPGHLSEDDYTIEASNVKSYMAKLFDDALMSTSGNLEFAKQVVAQDSEVVLLRKWRDLLIGLLPPNSTRGRRFFFAGSRNSQEVVHTQYTLRQLEYIGLLLKKMLNVKQHILQADYVDEKYKKEEMEKDGHIEDVIYILVTIMDQARDQYLNNQTNPNIIKNKSKIKLQYNLYTCKLVELIRKDKEIHSFNFEDDLVLVKLILKWLYKAMDQNKRYLAPILRPYLNNIFATSHSISWHLESIKQRLNNDELEALGAFASLVNSGQISPAEGLMDAVNKNWIWAREMLKMVETHSLRLVFISGRNNVYRHILSLPSYQMKSCGDGSKTESRPGKAKPIKRQKTLPSRNYFNSILKEKFSESNDSIPQHDNLKSNSPLNRILLNKHRRGEHRGCGDILKTLLAMQKINMFQDVTNTLPQEERMELTDLIKRLQSFKPKRSNRIWSSSVPQYSRNRLMSNAEPLQKYIPKEESAGIRINNPRKQIAVQLKPANINTLIGSCRAARIREDSGVFLLHDSFKVKSLLNKSESFKY